MKAPVAEPAKRRASLQLEAAAQRRRLGEQVGEIEARFRGVDQGFLKVRGLLRKPALFAGGAALALFLGPRRALGLAGRVVLLTSTVRRVFRMMR